jgi:hypothetical protein
MSRLTGRLLTTLCLAVVLVSAPTPVAADDTSQLRPPRCCV